MSVDRKALIRQYKETARPMGVGVVRNLATGKTLVVAGVDLTALLTRHRVQLKFGGHQVKALQVDWNAQGADAFAFEVLDTLEPPDEPTPGWDPTADLKALEQLWMEKLGPFEPDGYHRRRAQ